MSSRPFATDQELMENVLERFQVMGVRVIDGKEYKSFPGAYIKCTADTVQVYHADDHSHLVGTIDLQGNITYPPVK